MPTKVPQRCPACGQQLPAADMSSHLWQAHRLVLDDDRVREPWTVIRDWIAEFKAHGDEGLLVRCQKLAQNLDPFDGSLRLQRLFLTHGVQAAEARAALAAAANQRRSALCPSCFALVPLPADAPPRLINDSPGRITFAGYCVAVTARRWSSWLEIATPTSWVYRGPEPGRILADRMFPLAAAAPWVALALLLAALRVGLGGGPAWPVLLVLTFAMLAYGAGWLRVGLAPNPLDRAVDHAWQRLVPQLHTGSFSAADADVAAALALFSQQHGQPAAREQPLLHLLSETERAASAGKTSVHRLAALWRLVAHDARAYGRDPVLIVVDQVRRSLQGALPFAFAEELLAEWRSPWWTPGNRARLRVLLLAAAFEEGWEVTTLSRLGQSYPVLSDVLGLEDRAHLAHLRLLWAQRPERPWDPTGPAVTVFELAGYPDLGSRCLGACPDLLLWDSSSLTGPSPHALISVCSRGIVFQDRLFPKPLAPTWLVSRSPWGLPRYEMFLGEQHFSFSLPVDGLVRRLEQWFQFFFSRFHPEAANVAQWSGPPRVDQLLEGERMTCSECGQQFRGRRGAVGSAVPAPAGVEV